MTRVSELCEGITGIAYPVDIDERHQTYQRKRQQQTERAVATETQKQPSRKAGDRKAQHDSTETLQTKATQCRNPQAILS